MTEENSAEVRARRLSPTARAAFADLEAKLAPEGVYVLKVRERAEARRARDDAIMALLTASAPRARNPRASMCSRLRRGGLGC